MEIIHCASKINKINTLEGVLRFTNRFISYDEYYNSGYQYILNVDPENIIHRRYLDDFKHESKRDEALHESVTNVRKFLGVFGSDAYSLLLGFKNVHDIEYREHIDLVEAHLFCQAEAAKCASKMGYDAVEDYDEKGSMYLVDCGGKEIVQEKKEGALLEIEIELFNEEECEK